MPWNSLLSTFVFKPLDNSSSRNVGYMHDTTDHCILHWNQTQADKGIEVNYICFKDISKIIIITSKTHVITKCKISCYEVAMESTAFTLRWVLFSAIF